MLIISSIDKMDTVNIPGGGLAITIWFAGCSANCKGCQNPNLQNKEGYELTANEVFEYILDTSAKTSIKNIVLLGGEPLEQDLLDLILLCELLNVADFNIYLYTGFEIDQIHNRILKSVKWIKTGRYISALYRNGFPSSSNQKIFIKIKNNNTFMEVKV